MSRNLFAFIAGGILGAGLLLSGMTDTAKVQGWLDIFGAGPDPGLCDGRRHHSNGNAWRLTEGRAPVLGGQFPAKPDAKFDRNLVLGSVLFGMGWGLAYVLVCDCVSGVRRMAAHFVLCICSRAC